MTKIHVIKDESLGGVEREYIEVDRKAEVGESVYTIISGEFRKVTRVEGVGAYLDDGGLVFHENYRVLEPTDIVRLREQRFRLVDRKAKVGERVIVVNEAFPEEYYEPGYTNGDIFTAKCVDIDDVLALKGTDIRLYHSEYRVLVPVESESSPQSTEDVIANLVARVAQLERRDEEHRHVIERMGLEIDAVERSYSGLFSGIKRDIETWAQEVEKVRVTAKYAEAKVHKVIRDVDDLTGEVRQVDDKIEMCIDDIVALDERTSETKGRCCRCN